MNVSRVSALACTFTWDARRAASNALARPSDTGWAWQLHKMRDAIEEALEERGTGGRHGRNKGGAVVENQEDGENDHAD